MKVLEFLQQQVPEAAPVFMVTGAEAFLREEATSRIAASLPPEVEVDVVYGPTSSEPKRLALADLFDDLRTASLFGQERMIHVKDADLLVKENKKVLSRFISGREGVHRLILEGESLLTIRAGKPAQWIKAILDAGGIHVQCDPLYATSFGGRGPVYQSPLSRWVQQRAGHHGKRISLENAWVLHQQVGTSLRELDAELAKLALFVKQRETITEDDVHAAVGASRLAPVFDLANAVLVRDAARALELSGQLFERGLLSRGGQFVGQPDAVAMTLVATLSSQVRKLAQAVEMMARGSTFDEAAAATKQPRFFLDRFRVQVAAWKIPADLVRLTAGLQECERGLKTGLGAPRVLWDRFLVQTLGAAKARSRTWVR